MKFFVNYWINLNDFALNDDRQTVQKFQLTQKKTPYICFPIKHCCLLLSRQVEQLIRLQQRLVAKSPSIVRICVYEQRHLHKIFPPIKDRRLTLTLLLKQRFQLLGLRSRHGLNSNLAKFLSVLPVKIP